MNTINAFCKCRGRFIISGNDDKIELQITPEGEILINKSNINILNYDLKHYLLQKRKTNKTLQGYLEYCRKCSIEKIATVKDYDFERKVKTAICNHIQ